MTSEKMVNVLNEILLQFEMNVTEADIMEPDALEAEESNRESVEALKIAIASFKTLEQLENKIHNELQNFVVKDTYTKGKNAGLRKVIMMLNELRTDLE